MTERISNFICCVIMSYLVSFCLIQTFLQKKYNQFYIYALTILFTNILTSKIEASVGELLHGPTKCGFVGLGGKSLGSGSSAHDGTFRPTLAADA